MLVLGGRLERVVEGRRGGEGVGGVGRRKEAEERGRVVKWGETGWTVQRESRDYTERVEITQRQ